jgi:hypothetical protein
MIPTALDRAVARRTGESPRTIAALGFGPLADLPAESGDGPARLAVSCPGCAAPVLLSDAGLCALPERAACPGCGRRFAYRYDDLLGLARSEGRPAISPARVARC